MSKFLQLLSKWFSKFAEINNFSYCLNFLPHTSREVTKQTCHGNAWSTTLLHSKQTAEEGRSMVASLLVPQMSFQLAVLLRMYPPCVCVRGCAHFTTKWTKNHSTFVESGRHAISLFQWVLQYTHQLDTAERKAITKIITKHPQTHQIRKIGKTSVAQAKTDKHDKTTPLWLAPERTRGTESALRLPTMTPGRGRPFQWAGLFSHSPAVLLRRNGRLLIGNVPKAHFLFKLAKLCGRKLCEILLSVLAPFVLFFVCCRSCWFTTPFKSFTTSQPSKKQRKTSARKSCSQKQLMVSF